MITTYFGYLHDQWTAVVDVAGLLQIPDLFQLSDQRYELHAPDLESLLGLCCRHPCSPLSDPRLYGADGSWPPAVPAAPAAPAAPRLEPLPPPKVVPPVKVAPLASIGPPVPDFRIVTPPPSSSPPPSSPSSPRPALSDEVRARPVPEPMPANIDFFSPPLVSTPVRYPDIQRVAMPQNTSAPQALRPRLSVLDQPPPDRVRVDP